MHFLFYFLFFFFVYFPIIFILVLMVKKFCMAMNTYYCVSQVVLNFRYGLKHSLMYLLIVAFMLFSLSTLFIPFSIDDLLDIALLLRFICLVVI